MEDNFPESWAILQDAIRTGAKFPKIYPSQRRFTQVLKNYKISIKEPKKDYCGTCKAYDVDANNKVGRERDCVLGEKVEHKRFAWDTLETFTAWKKRAKKSHGLE